MSDAGLPQKTVRWRNHRPLELSRKCRCLEQTSLGDPERTWRSLLNASHFGRHEKRRRLGASALVRGL